MRLLATIAVLVVCTIHNIVCDDDDGTLVQVEQGLIRGEILKTVVENKKYYSFKGIRYAKPPIGNLRFKAPEKAEKWDGVLDATKHGSVCPQFNPMTAIYNPGNEDCMFLNIYSPDTKTKTPYPVIFFIHGGANIFGSGNSDLYGPDYFIAQDTLVVTINYRLAFLGFLSMGSEEVPGNAGLKDQVLALEWVQKNIVNFGGDPNSVTLIGDTAGGHAVTLHMLSPMSKGLFHKAIAMSGSASCDFAVNYKPERKAQILGELSNCSDIENTTALLSCLQAVPNENLYPLLPKVLAAEYETDKLFKKQDSTPVIERKTGNNFLTEDWQTALANGNLNNEVDFMIGYGSKEALLLIDLFNASYIEKYNRYRELLAPSEHLTKCTPDTILEVARRVKEYYFGDKPVTVDNIDLFVNYASNTSIAYHAQRFANKWAPLGKNTYFFQLDYYTSWNFFGQQGAKYGINQTSHFDFGYYIFYPNSLNWTVSTDSLEYQLSQKLVTSIVNFVKSGDPSVDDCKWPTYNTSDKAFVTFGNDGMKVGHGPDEDDYNFWKGIFEYAEIPF